MHAPWQYLNFVRRPLSYGAYLFKDESAFRDFISEKLQEKGYELMGSDVVVHGRKRVDLLMKKGQKIVAIEVKLRDRKGIVEDITKLSRLRFLPDINLFFVAAPKINLQEDILGFAKRMRIGVFAVTEQAIEPIVQSEEAYPPHLSSSTSIPKSVILGEVFEIRISVMNGGEKMARNIKIMYMPAYPFRVPKSEKNHKLIKKLMSGKQETVTFKIRVEDDTEAGTYPLYIRRTAEGLMPSDSLHHIEVEKKLG